MKTTKFELTGNLRHGTIRRRAHEGVSTLNEKDTSTLRIKITERVQKQTPEIQLVRLVQQPLKEANP